MPLRYPGGDRQCFIGFKRFFNLQENKEKGNNKNADRHRERQAHIQMNIGNVQSAWFCEHSRNPVSARDTCSVTGALGCTLLVLYVLLHPAETFML